eukprot:2960496-Rhodomonas_salina.1
MKGEAGSVVSLRGTTALNRTLSALEQCLVVHSSPLERGCLNTKSRGDNLRGRHVKWRRDGRENMEENGQVRWLGVKSEWSRGKKGGRGTREGRNNERGGEEGRSRRKGK